MKLEVLKKEEVNYIVNSYTLEDIKESTALEVANFLWFFFISSKYPLGKAENRFDEIVNSEKEVG